MKDATYCVLDSSASYRNSAEHAPIIENSIVKNILLRIFVIWGLLLVVIVPFCSKWKSRTVYVTYWCRLTLDPCSSWFGAYYCLSLVVQLMKCYWRNTERRFLLTSLHKTLLKASEDKLWRADHQFLDLELSKNIADQYKTVFNQVVGRKRCFKTYVAFFGKKESEQNTWLPAKDAAKIGFLEQRTGLEKKLVHLPMSLK